MKLSPAPLTALAALALSIPAIAQESERGAKSPGLATEKRSERPVVKVHGHALVVRPDGTTLEANFGEAENLDFKFGGAQIDLKIAAKKAGIDEFMGELDAAFQQHGFNRELVEMALAGLHDVDHLAHTRIQGFVVGPDGERREFRLGNAIKMKPRRLKKKLNAGGASLVLEIAPGEGLFDLMGGVLSNPEALKFLAESTGNPNVAGFLGEAMKDPNIQGLLQQGLNDPAMRKLAEDALKDGRVQEMMRQFLGGAPVPEIEAEAAPQSEAAPEKPAKGAGQKQRARERHRAEAPSHEDSADQDELRALKRELREQRAMLEKILERLETEK